MGRTDSMGAYWDARARENAAFYVDTTCDYRDPDMAAFFAAGRRIVDAALVEAPCRPAGRRLAVEIGPGLGRVCAALAGSFDRVVGVDVSLEMVRRARTLVPDPKVDFVVGSGSDLGCLVDGCADFVTTFTVLQHLPEPILIEGYLREASRVLVEGGILAAQWNNLPHPWSWRARGAWWRLRRCVVPPLRADPRASREFVGTRLPFTAVRRALEASGMTVRATSGLGTLFAWVWAQKQAPRPSPS